MTEYLGKKYEQSAAELVEGFDDMPVLVRLEFVINVLCRRAGEPWAPSYDPTLSFLADTLEAVARDLKSASGSECRIDKACQPS